MEARVGKEAPFVQNASLSSFLSPFVPHGVEEEIIEF